MFSAQFHDETPDVVSNLTSGQETSFQQKVPLERQINRHLNEFKLS